MNHSAPLARFVDAGLVDRVLLAGRWILLDQSAIDDLLPTSLEYGGSVIAAGVFNSGALADPDAGDISPTSFTARLRQRSSSKCDTSEKCVHRSTTLIYDGGRGLETFRQSSFAWRERWRRLG
jgi:D-threo-aldose 1-dehydrogenase